MLVEVKVPQLSESVAEATLVTWHRKVGEYVARDENLVDIETDKVALETPAPESGVLATIIKGDGGTVVSGEVIATIDTEGKPQAPSPGGAVAVDGGDPHDVQRSKHAARDRSQEPLQGQVRAGARRQARIHVIFRQ